MSDESQTQETPTPEPADARVQPAERNDQALPRLEDWEPPWGENQPFRIPTEPERAKQRHGS